MRRACETRKYSNFHDFFMTRHKNAMQRNARIESESILALRRVSTQRRCDVMQALAPYGELVSFPDPTTHARKGPGDISADSWFCKLSNHVMICIDLYWHTCSHVMVHRTKKTLQCPQTLSLLSLRVGSGNETGLNACEWAKGQQFCECFHS